MKIVCTICSKHKRADEELLPARLRYVSSHIQATEEIAKENNTPFFILSGKFGLISADEKIPNYDYYLKEEAIDPLSEIIRDQIKNAGITEISFYTEGKESWVPYESAIKKGARLANVPLLVSMLLMVPKHLRGIIG